MAFRFAYSESFFYLFLNNKGCNGLFKRTVWENFKILEVPRETVEVQEEVVGIAKRAGDLRIRPKAQFGLRGNEGLHVGENGCIIACGYIVYRNSPNASCVGYEAIGGDVQAVAGGKNKLVVDEGDVTSLMQARTSEYNARNHEGHVGAVMVAGDTIKSHSFGAATTNHRRGRRTETACLVGEMATTLVEGVGDVNVMPENEDEPAIERH